MGLGVAQQWQAAADYAQVAKKLRVQALRGNLSLEWHPGWIGRDPRFIFPVVREGQLSATNILTSLGDTGAARLASAAESAGYSLEVALDHLASGVIPLPGPAPYPLVPSAWMTAGGALVRVVTPTLALAVVAQVGNLAGCWELA